MRKLTFLSSKYNPKLAVLDLRSAGLKKWIKEYRAKILAGRAKI